MIQLMNMEKINRKVPLRSQLSFMLDSTSQRDGFEGDGNEVLLDQVHLVLASVAGQFFFLLFNFLKRREEIGRRSGSESKCFKNCCRSNCCFDAPATTTTATTTSTTTTTTATSATPNFIANRSSNNKQL